MKRLSLLLASMLVMNAAAQESKSSIEKIYEVYGSAWDEIVAIDSQRQSVFIDLLENRVEIALVPYEKGEKYTPLSTVPLFNKFNSSIKADETFDPENFNILKYDLPFFSMRNLSYRVDGTDYVIFIKSQNR